MEQENVNIALDANTIGMLKTFPLNDSALDGFKKIVLENNRDLLPDNCIDVRIMGFNKDGIIVKPVCELRIPSEKEISKYAEDYALDYIGKKHEPEYSQTKNIYIDGFNKALELIQSNESK